MNLDARVGQLDQSHLDVRRGQGRSGNKWFGESRLRKGQESLGGRGSGQGPESQGSGEFRGQGKWSGPGEPRLRNSQENLGGRVIVRVRRLKTQEKLGEIRGQGK
jgi:hypothetical protein